MEILSFTTGPLGVNSYLVFVEGEKSAILIDAGGDINKIHHYAESNGVVISHLLLTHGHFDHVGAAAELQREGCIVYLHENDWSKVQTSEGLCGFSGFSVPTFTPDFVVQDGDVLELAGLKIKVLHTPGHTSGSVCYIIENVIFSGDTLFSRSFGRTDLGDGSIRALANSIVNKIFALNGNFRVCPGHEGESELDFERKVNPILYYV